jgi:hypothetical protein
MRIRHNISPKSEEGMFTYALLLARVSLRKTPPDMAINTSNLIPTLRFVSLAT